MNKLAFCFKKPVEYQYSSSNRKKTHTFTIIAMNSVQEQFKICEIISDYSEFTCFFAKTI